MIIFLLFDFTEEFANLLPQEFVDHYLIDLNVKHVVAGFDYTYGTDGKRYNGNTSFSFKTTIYFFRY